MAAIGLDSVYEGVRLLLQEAFPGRQIHGGDGEQELEPGDLGVALQSAEQTKQVGRRFLCSCTFDVRHRPDEGETGYGVAQELSLLLQSITTPEGDILHCTSCNRELTDGILHAYFTYIHHAYIPEEHEPMETLEIRQEGL